MSFWKISKIYPGRPMGGDRAQMYFFSSNLQRSLWRKKKGICRPPQTGDRAMSPVGGRQGPLLQLAAAIPFVI